MIIKRNIFFIYYFRGQCHPLIDSWSSIHKCMRWNIMVPTKQIDSRLYRHGLHSYRRWQVSWCSVHVPLPSSMWQNSLHPISSGYSWLKPRMTFWSCVVPESTYCKNRSSQPVPVTRLNSASMRWTNEIFSWVFQWSHAKFDFETGDCCKHCTFDQMQW